MKLTTEIETKAEDSLLEFTMDDFLELKRFYNQDNKNFVKFIDRCLSSVRKKEDLEGFLYFFENIKTEIIDVSPFLAANINKIVVLLIKNNYYKQIAEYSFLLENCANIKILQMLNDFIKGKSASKFLTTMEQYKIKKLVFDLTNKFKNNDVVYKIDVELENEDLNWMDNIEH